MMARHFKPFTALVLGLFIVSFFNVCLAGEDGDHEKKKGFNATEVIFGHILNAHEFHILDIVGKDG
ncbi:MAG: F0F1 ATP synthase subunit A, partial [Bacteroidia bacterium]|nr:F0F1 ATP synthase subunit A [Bacteroidia bacterium]